MNFIYTILSFLLSAVIFILTAQQFPPSEHLPCLRDLFNILGGIFSFATICAIFSMLFGQMNKKDEFIRQYNQLRCTKESLNILIQKLEDYKLNFNKLLTETYPSYEKDLFKNMGQDDVESLTNIFIKYPELKFDGVLSRYVNGLDIIFNEINKCKMSIIYDKKELSNINSNQWLLIPIKEPKLITINL